VTTNRVTSLLFRAGSNCSGSCPESVLRDCPADPRQVSLTTSSEVGGAFQGVRSSHDTGATPALMTYPAFVHAIQRLVMRGGGIGTRAPARTSPPSKSRDAGAMHHDRRSTGRAVAPSYDRPRSALDSSTR
jgi:hypothetical protein